MVPSVPQERQKSTKEVTFPAPSPAKELNACSYKPSLGYLQNISESTL